MNAIASAEAFSGPVGVGVPSQREALTTSLLPVMEKALANIVAKGEAIGGRVPASRVVWGVIEWIDHCMVEGFGLRAVREAIVEVASRLLGEFKLSYQSLRSYRAMLSARMQGGTVARVQAMSGKTVEGVNLHPSPRAAAVAREAARREADGEVEEETASPVERVLNAVGYGGLGQGERSAATAKLMIRRVSLAVEKHVEAASGLVRRALGRVKAAAEAMATAVVVPVVVPPMAQAVAPPVAATAVAAPLARTAQVFVPKRERGPDGKPLPAFGGKTPAELDAAHRAELRARDEQTRAKFERMIAERENRS
jgi:hypothetical protein